MSLERYGTLIEQSEPNLEVRSIVGVGGWGVVFSAWHKVLERTIAVKVIRVELINQEPETWHRFLREATTLSHLTHKNVVRVYSFGRLVDGSPFVTMEFLNGAALEAEIPLSLERFQTIFLQACDALICLHENSVLHRDLKTSNIMLVKDERGADLLKLVDFGLALDQGATSGEVQRLTATGEAVGTPAYMSPEQCLGRPVDARSDLYSLGCVMYEALTSRTPFQSESSYEVMMMHAAEPPAPLNYPHEDKRVTTRVEAIILRCLAKDPEYRYQSAEEIRDDLASIFKRQSNITPVVVSAPIVKKRKQPVLRIAMIAALLLAAPLAVALQNNFFAPRTSPVEQELRRELADQNVVSPHNDVVDKLLKEGKPEEAVTAARLLVANRSTRYSRGMLANTLSQAGHHDEAIQVINEVLRSHHLHTDSHFWGYRGFILFRARKYKECIENFDQAVKFSSNPSANWLSTRAMAWHYLGDDKKAAADFAKALRLDDDGHFEFKQEAMEFIAKFREGKPHTIPASGQRTD